MLTLQILDKHETNILVSIPAAEGEMLHDLSSRSGPEVLKLFSCSSQKSAILKLVINIEIAKISH